MLADEDSGPLALDAEGQRANPLDQDGKQEGRESAHHGEPNGVRPRGGEPEPTHGPRRFLHRGDVLEDLETLPAMATSPAAGDRLLADLGGGEVGCGSVTDQLHPPGPREPDELPIHSAPVVKRSSGLPERGQVTSSVEEYRGR